MEKAGVDILMGRSIKACGEMDNLMARGLKGFLMNQFMKACGRMANVMELELKRLKTVQSIKAHGMKEDLNLGNVFILTK